VFINKTANSQESCPMRTFFGQKGWALQMRTSEVCVERGGKAEVRSFYCKTGGGCLDGRRLFVCIRADKEVEASRTFRKQGGGVCDILRKSFIYDGL